jgi:hypothetical protein
VNKDGSGAIKVEYRLAGDLESLGKLDGNERWLPLPAGKADLERTADRIEGLKLLSASQKTKGKDSVLGAEFSFASPEALNAFFDASGQAFTADIPGRRMVLVFPESGDQNPDFKALLSAALEGYGFSLAFSLPGAARVAWFDGEGGAAPSFPGNCAVQGSTVEYSVPMAELVFLDRTLTMEISW